MKKKPANQASNITSVNSVKRTKAVGVQTKITNQSASSFLANTKRNSVDGKMDPTAMVEQIRQQLGCNWLIIDLNT